ncbi:MAG TPA: hypothetical protein HA283_05865 [Nanoarchaeota archaeon]|nr:hypothetical protein [Nanoarchaeota archaeon]HIH63796.1 hypothetical protein [Nanoarchaeota archaeon]HIJ09669.1 hypothetical protein [Nanoarchaeota archaeon]
MDKKLFLIIGLLISITSLISAEEFTNIISNSENWQDVYSIMHYANLKNVEGDFITSTEHGTVILNGINKENKIKVITSKDNPYLFNYKETIESQGFQGVEEITVEDANLELINDLPEIQNFILVGDSFGYNAIAVIPYAILTDSWVFLANRLNAQEIDFILSERNVKKVLIYGYVDREVRDAIEKYNPEIIDNEDRFQDNIEIVEKFLAIQPTKQALLTNGEFIEKELMKGKEPIIFTGKENVPDQIRDYLKDSMIEIGVLIGNDLINTATNIRRSTGISVMVKFARGARSQQSGISAVEGLDLFPLPTPTMNLELHSVKYNKINSQLEVTYKSSSNIPIYFKGTITVKSDTESIKVGDTQPTFITPENFKTVIYPLELKSLENLSAEIYTIYGDSKSSSDRILKKEIDIGVIEVLDKCKIEIKDLKYNKQSKSFIIEIKNLENANCWVSVELEDVLTGYTKKTIGTEKSIEIPAKKSKAISIKEEMTEEELISNKVINLIAHYGEREENLVNIIQGEFELNVDNLTTITYAILILLLLIILLIVFLFVLKKDDDEEI